MKDKSHKTAITRNRLSRPAKFFSPFMEGKVLDCGCGKGSDADLLGADKYDPHFFQVKPEKESYDSVLSIYVLNTVGHPSDVLKMAKEYVKPGGLIMVATRTIPEIRKRAKDSNWKVHGRGWLTGSGTFQRGLSHSELASFLAGWEYIVKGSGAFSYVIARRPL